MTSFLSRRSFAAVTAGAVIGSTADLIAEDKSTAASKESSTSPAPAPFEAPFERDYEAPDFKPSWKRPQINRLLVQDFVIYAHMDPAMVKKLLVKEPGLVVATMNWGGGDWESGLNGAAHMGRRDIVELLLEHGARADIFCAAMLGQVDVVRAFLQLQPKLIDAKGPHGFSLEYHARVAGPDADSVLDYLKSLKKA